MFHAAPVVVDPPLIKAVASNDPSRVQNVIDGGTDVNMRSPMGKTPLHFAVEFGFKSVVLMLLSKGANVHAETVGGTTPLHVAAQRGHTDIIVELVAAGAKINACTKVETTPLHEAASNGHKDATTKLLELKEDPTIKDNRYSLTAANLAHENMHGAITEIICGYMTYQQHFIQNINFILFNWKRAFLPNTPEKNFLEKLSAAILNEENADEVYKKISAGFKSSDYEVVKEKLKPVRELIIANMHGYNQGKIAARGEQQDLLPSAAQKSLSSQTSKKK